VQTRSTCRQQDVDRIGIGFKSANILGDGAVEQFHVLRQVADVTAECIGCPLVERSAVERDPPGGRARSDQGPGQRRLARSTRANNADPLAGLEDKACVLNEDFGGAGSGNADVLNRQSLHRIGQRHRLLRSGEGLHQFVEPLPALAGPDKRFPVAMA
jgi:hypothetical protein